MSQRAMSWTSAIGKPSPRSGLGVVALCLLMWMSAQPSDLAAQDPPDTLIVAVVAFWPPHYQTGPDGAPTGFAVDMMEAVSQRIGIPIRYRTFSSFAAVAEALRNGTVDVIPDFGITPERITGVAFTRPFETFRVSIFVRETDPRVQTGDDLAGLTVGTVQANAAIALLGGSNPAARLVVYDSPVEALYQLLAAGVDAVAFPEEVMLAIARTGGVDDRIRTVPPALAEIRRAMAVRQGDTLLLAALDRGVAEVVASPEFGTIYLRWFGPPRDGWTVKGVLWIAGAALLLVLMGMAVWRYLSMTHLAAELARTLAERDAARVGGRRDEERFRTLVNTAYEGIMIGDVADRIEFANRRACELLRRDESEVVGGSFFDFVDEEYHDRFRAGIERRQQGHSDNYEVVLNAADGARVPVLFPVAPLKGEDGAFEGAVAMIADLTAREAAEKALLDRERRFRAFVENSSELISTLSAEGLMDYQSPTLTRLLGYTEDELHGRSGFDLIDPEDREAMEAAWNTMLDQPGQPVETPPFRFRHKDGSWRTLVARLTNLLEDPAVGAVLSNAEDITARKELEHKFLQAQKLEAIGQLAGGIAHDFNNLLTVMRIQTDLILLDLSAEHPLTPEVAVIQRAADRAATLTGQLLAFSRDQVLQPRLVSVSQVIQETASLLTRIIGSDIEIRVEVPGELPSVFLDPVHLEQVLMNLGVNARDAMPRGGTLTLAARLGALDQARAVSLGDVEAGDYVMLEVSDTGTGMDLSTLARVFEPFFTTKENGRGTGLGLSMVYGFVKQSGGAIEVTSTPGVGTRFQLHFPAMAGAPPEQQDPLRRRALAVDREQRAILVVEDTEDVARVIRKILERAGYAVTEAPDAETALALMEDVGGEIDLVLSDFGLPGMSGRVLVDRLRATWPGLPCIVASGYAADSPGDRGNLPADLPFLQKPFTAEALLEVVHDVMGDP